MAEAKHGWPILTRGGALGGNSFSLFSYQFFVEYGHIMTHLMRSVWNQNGGTQTALAHIVVQALAQSFVDCLWRLLLPYGGMQWLEDLPHLLCKGP